MKNKVKIINSSTIGQEGRYLKTSGGHKIHLPKQSRISYTKMIFDSCFLSLFLKISGVWKRLQQPRRTEPSAQLLLQWEKWFWLLLSPDVQSKALPLKKSHITFCPIPYPELQWTWRTLYHLPIRDNLYSFQRLGSSLMSVVFSQLNKPSSLTLFWEIILSLIISASILWAGSDYSAPLLINV